MSGIRYSRHNIGSDGLCARLTACVALFLQGVWSVLNNLPKTVDGTYGRTLLWIYEEKREYAQCLMVSIRPLRVEELAKILAVQFDTGRATIPTFNAAWRPENAEEAISACSSLIAIVDRKGSRVV